MDKQKNIPLKNYIILSIILIVTAILAIYFYKLYDNYIENKLNTPIMDRYMRVIKYNELESYLIENGEGIIYCSILENEDVRNFEKKFKNIIREYSLSSNILYLNLTDELQDNKIAKEIQEKYQINGKSIIEVPSIAIFRNKNLISIYNIKDNNYDIEKIINYFKEEGIIND